MRERKARPDCDFAQGERNLAAILFEERRYEESAAAFRRLVAADPEDAALRTSLAGALGALGRLDEALEQLEAASELDALNVEAYHNRAVVLERIGRSDEAVEQYRTALRYAPDYEPSQQALLRLTGSAQPNAPHSESEARALAARRERRPSRAAPRAYESSMRQLEEAEPSRPDYTSRTASTSRTSPT